MKTIIVENVDRAIGQMKGHLTFMKGQISSVILNVGDSVVSRLQTEFPDLTITSNYFPNNMEYWIGISRLGQELTWIKCPVSNLFFERERQLGGEQRFVSSVPELDIDRLVQEITNELSLQLNQVVGRKV